MNTQHHFNDFFTHQLNPEQQKVVAPYKGILLVTAGAGSGKTRVITARMANLILNHAVRPHEIIALTFTNKAAKEMKERIMRAIGDDSSLPYVGTFHSYCLRLLKSNTHLLPFSTFSLIDESDQEKVVKTLIQQKGLSKKVTPKQVLSSISRIKNEATNDREREAVWGHDLLMRDLYLLYEQHKAAAHCFDFDDLLLQGLALFEKNSLFKKVFQEHVKHILVDEYQDTNKVQHALLTAMTKNEEKEFALDSLCVVGDEDQSIYSWRGATVTNIIHFTRDFPSAVSVTIERNYRSVQPILHVANEVIKQNTFRNPKTLYSEKEAIDRIRLLTCASSYQEGEALASLLKVARRQSNHHSLSDYAVLYRSHFQSRPLEEALIRHSIPYKIMGGIQFYDRLEIKDMLAYMRLLLNPFDRIAFSRIINTPTRGLGDKFEELFYQTWDMMPFASFDEIARSLIAGKQLTKVKEESLTTFLQAFEGLSDQTKPSKVLMSLIERTGYYKYLQDAFDKDEAEAKKENIKELINGVLYFEEHNQPTLDAFLQEVALLQEQMNATEEEENSGYVRLMTFHAAKGLEFTTVVLTGIEEGILPSTRSLYNPESLEEERRLLYVGITRARERLLLMRTKYRYTYGQMTDQLPSRFLDEMPEDHVPQDDCSYWKEQAFEQYFSAWLKGEGHTKSSHQKKSLHKASWPNSLDNKEFQRVAKSSNGSEGTHFSPASKLSSFADPFDDEPAEETTWQRFQSVTHKTFGKGVIEKIEQNSSKTYLTIRFKTGIKKLDAAFVDAHELV